MSNEIIDILNKVGEQFGITIDWTSKNVLPYLETIFQRATSWMIGEAIVWIVVCAVPMILILLLGVRFIKGVEDDCDMLGPGLFCIFIAFILIIPIVCNIMQIVRCNTFPELEILDLIKGLM